MYNSLKRNLKFISVFISVGFVIGIFYSFMIFQPVYKSASRVLIEEKSLSNHVYLLKSSEFAGKVWKKIRKKHELAVNNELGTEKIKKAINIKNPVNTHIIDVTAAWADPIMARDIARTFIAEYKNVNPEIIILDTPKVPFYSSFPGRMELISLFTIFSGIMALIIALLRESYREIYNSPEEIEKDLNVPVMGTIPWLEKEIYDEPDIMFAIDEAASFYSLAYQKAVSCLKLRGNNQKKKVFAFTSSEFSKFRSTIIMNIAYGLSRTGESVVVVDADFRTPSIGRDLGLKLDNKGDLTELLSDLSEDIDHYIYSVPGIKNFYIIPNNGNSADPSLYLYSDSFRRLIHKLKLKYDRVFIDTPPVLAVPDTFMIGPSIDGVILVTGFEPDKPTLRKIQKQLETYEINMFGIITRELQTQEAVSANMYIKQMITRLMTRGQNMVVE